MFGDVKTCVARAGLLAGMLALSACAYTSKVDANGHAEKLAWPPESHVSAQKGVYPLAENLHNVRPGQTKDQIRSLLGTPESVGAGVKVVEWNYIFNFRTAGGETVCQYKVLFDTQLLAQTFYWKPESCAGLVDASRPAPVK